MKLQEKCSDEMTMQSRNWEKKSTMRIKEDNMKCLTNIDEGGYQLPKPWQGEGHEADEVGGGDDSRTHAHTHTSHAHAHRTQLNAHHAALIWLWPDVRRGIPG